MKYQLAIISLCVCLFTLGCGNEANNIVSDEPSSIKTDSAAVDSQKDNYSIIGLEFGGLKITVDPAVGGRLASLEFDGTSMIRTERDKENLHWGSTVWPSPQSQWNWPPPALMDQGEYMIKINEPKMLLLESPPNAYLGLTVKKRYHLRDPRTLDITYQFFNEKDTTIQVGIWENTRIDYQGQISWATVRDQKIEVENISKVADETRLMLGGQKEKKKIFINSDQGWVAYQKNGVELKKTFPIISPKNLAKDQSPIEVYIDPVDGFAEIEEHGAYETLGPGAVATFRVRWNLRSLPK